MLELILWNSKRNLPLRCPLFYGNTSCTPYRLSEPVSGILCSRGLACPWEIHVFRERHDVIDSSVSAQSSSSLSLGHLKPRPSSRHLNITFRKPATKKKSVLLARNNHVTSLSRNFQFFLNYKKKRQFFAPNSILDSSKLCAQFFSFLKTLWIYKLFVN